MKQVEKISLACLKSKLTRNEMKNVMAGSGGGMSCSEIASMMANLEEERIHAETGSCLTSAEFNALYTSTYNQCVAGN
jgi:hypothetical protein